MSGYKITKNEVEDMEWVLLDKNEWMLHPPTALSFARLLLGFLTVATKKIRLIIEIAHHLVELSACGKCHDIHQIEQLFKANNVEHNTSKLITFEHCNLFEMTQFRVKLIISSRLSTFR